MRISLMCETFLPDVNGVTTTLCRLLEYLQHRGHEVLLLAPHDAPSTYAGAQIIPLNGMPLPMYPEVKLTPPQPGLSAHLRRFRPDLLHLVGPAVAGVMVPFVAQNLNLPLVGSYHTDFGAYSRHYGLGFFQAGVNRWLRWIHNRCRVTLCPSTHTIKTLRQSGFRRLRLWGRGVDTEQFHPRLRSSAWREAVGCQPGESLLLYVGRVAAEKRVDLLPEALRGLDKVRLVVVGDGPFRSELERRADGLPIHFTGYLKGQELATAYASADAFVFPSDTDTFGQVIQEAMASGLPVVGARSGGTLDLVRDHQTGYLFAPGVASDLRVRLRSLIANPEQRLAMGHAGRAAAEQRSWPHVLDELLDHYATVSRQRWAA
ncbi:glycosyltransferase family 1 protein [Candidatus Chloroploca sp. M-50]|uniref:Glycosyltransferase family 1 protein n=1 Tax=Candidatus Chloroploca mongolica TaxID=2528176 RepID=A0ABS4D773_9CHLR|nr:glycosyltransferase family 1 protein [Candidatus Chloroploca mongolica]MBP1465279.1 glycosyltransferase family 1 protein [Candidatus Chloroploca mongolica]